MTQHITTQQGSPHDDIIIFAGMVEMGITIQDECDACGAERLCLNYQMHDGDTIEDRLICAQCLRDVAEWLDEHEFDNDVPDYDGPTLEDLS